MRHASLARTVLLVSTTYVPLFFSILLFHPDFLADRPAPRFLLTLFPFWWAYGVARWYIRMAEKSFILYHPLGCLTQCCVWVFHWVVVVYHAFFATAYTTQAFLTTVFCVVVIVIEEGLFHSLVTVNSPDPANLGTYEKVRRIYAQGLIFWAKLWYLVDAQTLQRNGEKQTRSRRGRLTRSVTL